MVPGHAIQSITAIWPGVKASDYGTDTVDDWDNPVRQSVIDGCSVQPPSLASARQEYNVDRSNIRTMWSVWAPMDADIGPRCRVVYAGDTYDIDGEIEQWGFPPLDHLVIHLRRSEG